MKHFPEFRAAPREARLSIVLAGLLVLQAGCTVFLVLDAAADLTGLDDAMPDWFHTAFEAAVVVALAVGTGVTALAIRELLRRQARIEDRLRAASGAFADLLADQFERWRLTPSEAEVAMLAVKGLSIAEIARMRGTREGTVKAQLNAVYTKAGVTGRPQLVSHFVEELMAEPLTGRVAT